MAIATSDDPEHEPAERPEPTRGRQFWELREDDKRLLFITIVGGLAANIGLVLIVGLGLAEAHLIHRYQHSLAILFGPQLAAITGSVSGAFAGAISSRRTGPGRQKSRRSVTTGHISLGIAVLLTTILILALVGYAAGVK